MNSHPLITLSVCTVLCVGICISSHARVYVSFMCMGAPWTNVCKQERRVGIWSYLSESMSYSPEFLRASWLKRGRLYLCLVCTVWGWGVGLSRGHCLVKLKEERWHAVSLSWRSPLNALAPPDISYSDKETAVPAACQGIPPFNWALTQDSFHSPPRASLGADKTMRVTKLGLRFFRLRGWWILDLHKNFNL